MKNVFCNYFLADVYRRVNFEGLQICPHFADFEFTNWTRNGEVPYCQLMMMMSIIIIIIIIIIISENSQQKNGAIVRRLYLPSQS